MTAQVFQMSHGSKKSKDQFLFRSEDMQNSEPLSVKEQRVKNHYI